jgi:hypothetical protein
LKTRRPLTFLSTALVAGLLTACQPHDCVPANIDGAWEIFGATPPATGNVLESLIGKSSDEADSILGSEGLVSGQDERIWIFEQRKRLIYRTCSEPDVVSYRQDLIIVEAAFREEGIEYCEISRRGALSANGWRSQEEIISDPKRPLDGETMHCRTKMSE